MEKLFKEYFQGKQTLKQLALTYNRSIPWIKKHLDTYEPQERTIDFLRNSFCKKEKHQGCVGFLPRKTKYCFTKKVVLVA